MSSWKKHAGALLKEAAKEFLKTVAREAGKAVVDKVAGPSKPGRRPGPRR